MHTPPRAPSRTAFLESLERRLCLSGSAYWSTPGVGSIVSDPVRDRLYVTAADKVHRYDLAAGAAMEPIDLGDDLFAGAADITPDGRTLLVLPSQYANATRSLHLVDLATGAARAVRSTEFGVDARSVAIDSTGTATFVTSRGYVVQFELATETFVRRTDAPAAIAGYATAVARAANRSRLVFVGNADSNSQQVTFDPVTDAFSNVVPLGNRTNQPPTVNRDGTLVAVQAYGRGLEIRDAALNVVRSFPPTPEGFAFDPARDVLYRTEYGATGGSSDVIVGYDTRTWAELFRFSAEQSLGGGYQWLDVNPDGKWLFVADNLQPQTGLRILDLHRIEAYPGSHSVGEGGQVTIAGSGMSIQGGPIVSYEWDLDYDGTRFDVDRNTRSFSFSALGLDGPTTRQIALRVTDSRGKTATATGTLTITNVAPTPTVTGAAATYTGNPYTLKLAATDPGPDAVASWTIDWGDGTVETLTGNPASASHAYATRGAYTIRAAVADEDGAYDAPPLKVAVYHTPTVGPDGVMTAYGTDDGDGVYITVLAASLSLKLNGLLTTVPLAGATSVRLFTLNGGDWINAASAGVPLIVDGGDGGDDFLTGGNSSYRGPVTLVGGGGANQFHTYAPLPRLTIEGGAWGGDLLVVNGDQYNDTVAITESTLVNAGATSTYSRIGNLFFYGKYGSDSVTLDMGRNTATRVFLSMDGDSDTVHVLGGDPGGPAVTVNGGERDDTVVVAAGAGLPVFVAIPVTDIPGNDTLVLHGTPGDDRVDRVSASVTGVGNRVTFDDNLDQIRFFGGDGNDTVHSRGVGQVFDFRGEGGDDTFVYAAGSFAVRQAFDGGPGTDTADLTLFRNDRITVVPTAVRDDARPTDLASVENVTIAGTWFRGPLNLSVRGAAAGQSITLRGTAGDDLFQFGASGFTDFAQIAADVHIDAGDGNDSATFNDQANTAPTDYVLTPTAFYRPGIGRVEYAGVESVQLNTGSAADRVFVTMSPATAFAIDGGPPAPGGGPNTLSVDAAGATDVVVTGPVAGAGGYAASDRKPVTFANIDQLDPRSRPAAVDAAYDPAADPHALRFRFDRDVSAALSAGDLRVVNLTTGRAVPAAAIALWYDPATQTATFTFPGLPGGRLDDGNYRARLAAADVATADGSPLRDDAAVDFFVLAGDANRDRSVDFNDLTALAQHYGRRDQRWAGGDFNGDGRVDFDDLVMLSQRYNTALPPLPAPAPQPAAAAPAPSPGVFSSAPVIPRAAAHRPPPRR